MIESKELITGEVQGTSETKFVVLTEEEITKMMKKAAREGAKEGIAAYESKQACYGRAYRKGKKQCKNSGTALQAVKEDERYFRI